MKRSKANKILKARIEFSSEYGFISTKEDGEEYFSRSGCDICPDSLAGTVIDITFLAVKDTNEKVFDRIHEGSICGGCLCALVNSDNSDLDYYTTEEDEPALKA